MTTSDTLGSSLAAVGWVLGAMMAVQSTVGLLAIPFRGRGVPSGMASVLRNTAA